MRAGAGLLALLIGGIPSLASPARAAWGQETRPRPRELGIVIGRLPPGPLDAITDVEGVRVGHRTIVVGDSIRTGVTAIVPHGGDLYDQPVRAAIHVGNGFGKLVGLSQVNELGAIETPILLTGTLSVFRTADALLDTLLLEPAHADVRSMNPVVGETNDGWLSDIRARPIGPEHVRDALRAARGGPVEEGSVGAGTGTRTLGWKGGIGTASRRLPAELGGWTVGVLVQTNFGGELTVAGVPVGRILRSRSGDRSDAPDAPAPEAGARSGGGWAEGPGRDDREGGSVMIVLATDAPLAHRELERVAARTLHGVARTGSDMSHGSGDYAIAFSTYLGDPGIPDGPALSALFEAAMEATEEAVLASLFRATAVTGWRGHRSEALPVEPVLAILREAGVLAR